ncbi:MAG: ABC transporter permease, partial [Rhodococcus sp. (in: high G+C Gram-positive bacteria)]
MSTSDIGTLAPRTKPTARSAHGPSDPVKLAAVVLGLTA